MWLQSVPGARVLKLVVTLQALHRLRTSSAESPRRLGSSGRVELQLRLCSLPLAGSQGFFEVEFPSSLESHTYRVRPGALPVFSESLAVAGPPPTRVSLRSLSEDGLCLQSLSLDGVPAQGRFPVWLDNPCEGGLSHYGGVPCSAAFEWDVPTTTSTSTFTTTTTSVTTTTITSTTSTATATTTTVTTTSLTATTTATTSTRSSTTTTLSTTSTSTTVTSTTTTTTTTETTTTRTTTTTTFFQVFDYAPAERTLFASVAAAVSPPVFFDEMHAELDIQMNLDSVGSLFHSIEEHVLQAVTRFIGLVPPSSMRCRLRQTSDHLLAVTLHIRIMPQSGPEETDTAGDLPPRIPGLSARRGDTAEHIQELLTHPFHRTRLNNILHQGAEELVPPDVISSRRLLRSGLGAEDVSAKFDKNKYFLDTCKEGAMFCCVHAVVDSIVHNAGVIHAYRFYFVMALVLVLGVGFVWFWAASPCSSRRGIGSEKERGYLVMPLFALAVTFQAVLFGLKAAEKYMMLAAGCEDLPMGPCPPTKSVLVLELLFAVGLMLPLACFTAWWHRSWRADCQAERLQRRRQRHVISPLESMLRRSDICACYAVRATDKNSKTEHKLVLVLNVILSLAVTLTSFFLLQRYSFPTGLTAWFPYKLFYELFLASGLKFAFRIVVRQKLLGSFTFAFLCSSIALIGTLCTWLWITILRTVFSLHSRLDAWRIVRLLDISVGAGLVNCLLSSLSVSFAMYFFSIYFYEPKWRHEILRCVHLSHPEDQLGEVAAMVGLADHEDLSKARAGVWEIRSVRTAAGERVDLPESIKDEGEEREEEVSLCSSPQTHCSQASSRSARSVQIIRSLTDAAQALPSRSHPLIVDLRRTDAASCASRMVGILDYVLSVDSKLPVVRSSKECIDPRMDVDAEEDDFESSDSEGSDSESTEPSGTETESSEDHPTSFHRRLVT